MAVDYLSALNSKGSGLNITQIVDSLVEAETLPKKESIESDKSSKELEISALAEMKSELSTVQKEIQLLANSSKYVPSSSNTSALSIEVNDNSVASDFSSEVRVVSIASKQTLQFSNSGSFTTPNAAIGDGTLTINLGTWATNDSGFTNASPATSYSLSVAANDDLQTLATNLNALSGINASVLQTAPAVYSLVVRSEFGTDNAIKITTSDTALNAFRADPTVDATVQKTRAANSSLLVDGVSVTRPTNTITDLFSGYDVTVKGTSLDGDSPANGVTMSDPGFLVSSSLDVETATTSMALFVDTMNALRTKFDELTFRAITGDEESGALSSDPVAKSIIKKLRQLTEEPIKGFGVNDRHLSRLGVSTNRDGSLGFSSTTFQKRIKEDPTEFDAIFNTTVSTNTSLLQASKLGNSTPKAGSYHYSNDGSNSFLAGTEMLSGTDTTSGLTYYSSTSGDGSGVTVTPFGTVSSAIVFVGESLLDKLDSYLTTALASSADLSRRQTTITNEMSGLETDLLDLDDNIVSLKERYMSTFGAMEGAVTSLKGTGEYLENMVKSWNSDT